MGWLAMICAAAALGSLAVDGAGMFVAMALGIWATGLGLVGYRRRTAAPWLRLAGAAGMGLGAIALLLSGLKYGVTLAALARLEGMF